jgi:transposase-like protein
MLEGLRGESTIAELGRKEGTHRNMYYQWSKEFLNAGKQGLVGDTQRQAPRQEVVEMQSEIDRLSQYPPRPNDLILPDELAQCTQLHARRQCGFFIRFTWRSLRGPYTHNNHRVVGAKPRS